MKRCILFPVLLVAALLFGCAAGGCAAKKRAEAELAAARAYVEDKLAWLASVPEDALEFVVDYWDMEQQARIAVVSEGAWDIAVGKNVVPRLATEDEAHAVKLLPSLLGEAEYAQKAGITPGSTTHVLTYYSSAEEGSCSFALTKTGLLTSYASEGADGIIQCDIPCMLPEIMDALPQLTGI